MEQKYVWHGFSVATINLWILGRWQASIRISCRQWIWGIGSWVVVMEREHGNGRKEEERQTVLRSVAVGLRPRISED